MLGSKWERNYIWQLETKTPAIMIFKCSGMIRAFKKLIKPLQSTAYPARRPVGYQGYLSAEIYNTRVPETSPRAMWSGRGPDNRASYSLNPDRWEQLRPCLRGGGSVEVWWRHVRLDDVTCGFMAFCESWWVKLITSCDVAMLSGMICYIRKTKVFLFDFLIPCIN